MLVCFLFVPKPGWQTIAAEKSNPAPSLQLYLSDSAVNLFKEVSQQNFIYEKM